MKILRDTDFGIVSRYRTALMGAFCIWIIFHHNIFSWDCLTSVKKLFDYGNCGVDAFLMISGIGLYFSFSKDPKTGSFYKKRLVRILIPYIIFALPYYLWLDFSQGKGSFILYLSQVKFVTDGHITTWYIPAIFVFYLLFPLIFKLGKTKYGDTALVALCGVWAITLLVIKHFAPEFYSNTEIALTRLLSFVVGVFLGRIVKEKKMLPLSAVAASFVFCCMYYIMRRQISLSGYWIRMSLVPFALACIIAFSYAFSVLDSVTDRIGIKGLPVLEFFGKRSLEIYLSHVLIKNVYTAYFGTKHFDSHGIVDYLIIVAAAVALSAIVHPVSDRLGSALLKNKKKTA